jgi:hypothetical protein
MQSRNFFLSMSTFSLEEKKSNEENKNLERMEPLQDKV